MKDLLFQNYFTKRCFRHWFGRSIALAAILLLGLFSSLLSQASTPPFELSLRLEEGRSRLDWNSVSGAVYRVQTTAILSGASNRWRTVAAVFARGAQTAWLDPEKLVGNRFYRMLSPEVELRQVEPSIVDSGGGDEIWFIGQGISPTDKVRVAGVVLTAQTFVDQTSIRGRTPPLVSGFHDVELVNSAGQVIARRAHGLESSAPPALRLYEPPGHATAEPCDCSSCSAGPKGVKHLRLFSGEFHERVEDLFIKGRGLDFVWTRTYRSRSGPSTAQGQGWDFSYNIKIDQRGPDIEVQDGNGRADLFFRQSDGTFGRDEFFRVLSDNRDGTFTLLFPDLSEWRFNGFDGTRKAGKIARISDRSRNSLQFAYDAAGRLVTVRDTLGRDVQVRYNAQGFISVLVDFAGRQISYAYYASTEPGGSTGDLKSVTSPAVTGTPTQNDFPGGKTIVYTYTKGFNDERLNHNLLTITDPRNQTYLRNTYSGQTDPADIFFDRVVRHAWGGSNDVMHLHYVREAAAPGNGFALVRTILNDRVGNVREYSYDSRNRVVLHRTLAGRALPTRPVTEVLNRPTRPLRPADPAFFETRYEWNADSQPMRIIHPNGNITEKYHELEFDPNAPRRARGNLRTARQLPSRLGADQGELVSVFEYDTDFGGCCGANFVTRAVDPRGNVIQHSYDATGNLIRTVYPVPSIVEHFAYNQFGQMTEHRLPDNGSGHRKVDRYTYYGPSDGAQNGFLKEEIEDAESLALTTRYQYDAVGNAVSMRDPRGNDVRYAYNQLNQIVRETSRPVLLPGIAGGGIRYQTDRHYDANDNLVLIEVQNIDDQGVPGAKASFTTTHEYDILNKRTRTRKEAGVNSFVATDFAYDANRNLVLRRSGEAVNEHQGANVTQITYDERDLPYRKVRAPGDRDQHTMQSDYDLNGNRVRLLMGLEDNPREIRYSYDGLDRVTRVADAMGNLREYFYDANGNRVRHRVLGELSDELGGRGNLRLSEEEDVYDEQNRLVRTETLHFDPRTRRPLGDGKRATSIEYNANSQIIRRVDDRGNQTRTFYDTANREVQVIDAKGNTRGCQYDANSNLIWQEEEEQSDTSPQSKERFVTRYTYDGLDRLILMVDNVGSSNRYAHDSRDNRTLFVDALGSVTRMDYDGLNRLVQTRRFLAGTAAAPRVIATAQLWDDNSRLVGRADGNGNATFHTYDALDRLVRTMFADGSVRTAVFDVHGNEMRATDANGTVVETEYDLLNRAVRKTIKPGAGVANDTTFERYGYDGLNRLVRAEDDDSIVLREYDSLSDQTLETQNGQSVERAFDGIGNRLQTKYPGGRTVHYAYDELNRISAIADDQGPIAAYGYVGPHRVGLRQFTGGAARRTSAYDYDGARRMTSSVHSLEAAGAPTIDARHYGWDVAHHKTSRSDERVGGPRLTHAYQYDNAYRLSRTTVKDPAGVALRDTAYAIDNVGNRTAVADDNCAGAYSLSGLLPEPADRQMNQYTATGCDTRAYDANGNLLRVVDRERRDMAYDYRNQLVRHTSIAGRVPVVTTYAYDPLGRRISKTSEGLTPATTRFFYDGWQVIEERDGRGAILGTYVWGLRRSELLNLRRGGKDYYYHADDLGSVMAVTEASGKVLERYDYQDFGQPEFFDANGRKLNGSAIGNPILFTGQRYDEETGFYYCRTRYLDPVAGRFLTRDTLGIWGDPLSLGNGYTYAGNNPATWTDSMGQSVDRHISCNGPWPGPRVVTVEYEGCSKSRREGLDRPVCRGFRASGQAKRDIGDLWLQDYTGVAIPGTSTTRSRVAKWFGGPDGMTSLNSKGIILDVLAAVFDDGYKDDDIDIDCETGCDSGVNAYVNWGGWDVNLCTKFFNSSFSRSKKAAIIVHELTHAYAGTDDYFYYTQDLNTTMIRLPGDDDTITNNNETTVLRDNADTYEQFLLNFYLP